jgi:hypothetical protein|tara:strand:- start:4126 stop:4335 length:210 start_codon:yes stop_codon:yes gene_type:complete
MKSKYKKKPTAIQAQKIINLEKANKELTRINNSLYLSIQQAHLRIDRLFEGQPDLQIKDHNETWSPTQD